jgi:hypothetical protein
MSKHKITTDNKAFEFDNPKPTSTNPPEYHEIEKPKEVVKKTKPLNKNTEIYEYLFDQKLENNKTTTNNNNNNNNSQDIFDPKNMEYSTPKIPLLQILAMDSQIIVLNSVLSSHPFLNNISPASSSPSPLITSSIVDSNASTQASNISEIYELVPTLSLAHITLIPNTNRENK